jgi:hypothetical protein
MRRAVVADPGIVATLDEGRRKRYQDMQDVVSDAIQKTDDRRLKGWVAVAIWEEEEVPSALTVIGDRDSSYFELKGYLHDALWVAAHADH